MKILLFAASLRKGSYNKKFIENARGILAQDNKLELQKINLEDFDMPMYNGDTEESHGLPASVLKLHQLILDADALVVSTPEYNGSIPGVFKNMIDWTSRKKPICWEKKPMLLLGASPGALGAVRGLWHSRQPLEVLKVRLYPDMMGLQKAGEAFDEKDLLKDEKNKTALKALLENFIDYAKHLKNE